MREAMVDLENEGIALYAELEKLEQVRSDLNRRINGMACVWKLCNVQRAIGKVVRLDYSSAESWGVFDIREDDLLLIAIEEKPEEEFSMASVRVANQPDGKIYKVPCFLIEWINGELLDFKKACREQHEFNQQVYAEV